VWYQNICSALFGFVTHVTDKRTDRIATASIATRAVKTTVMGDNDCMQLIYNVTWRFGLCTTSTLSL